MYRHILLTLSFCLAAVATSSAQAPQNYYSAIDGLQGSNLQSALQSVIQAHKVFSYSDLWETYEVTDVVPGTKDQILEYYSDKVMYYTSRGTQINREHTVPQSWWGGGALCDAYTDLFNVLPAEASANNAKSNFPLGEVDGTAKFDNGVTRIGTSSNSGGATYVVEPADEFKGDFARIYFYVATCYASAPWTTDAYSMMTDVPTIKEWTLPTLLAWSEQDPVDEREMKRNEACYYLQHNRNPFVDYPQLAQYIWGDRQTALFELSDEQINTPSQSYTFVFKAARPTFSVQYGTSADAPQAVPEGQKVVVTSGNAVATLCYRVNEGEWSELAADSAAGYFSPSATLTISEDTRIDAFTIKEGRAHSDTITAYYSVLSDSEYLLFDDFASASAGDNMSTSGASSSQWSNDNFPSNENAYSAGGAIKLGTGSKTGRLTTRTLDYEGGDLHVELDVKGWTKIEGQLVVSVSDGQSQTVNYSALLADDFETVTADFSQVPANPTVSIATTQKRAFVDNVKITGSTDTPDAIAAVTPPISANSVWYSMTGCRIIGRPTVPGIYIVNGRKVIINQ